MSRHEILKKPNFSRYSKSNFLIILTLALLVVLVIAGCGGRTVVNVSPTLHVDSAVSKRIAVVEFDYQPPEKPMAGYEPIPNAGDAIADALATSLMGLRIYEIIERRQLERILQEHNLTKSDLVAGIASEKTLELLGVDGIIVGSVVNYGVQYRGRRNVKYIASYVEFSARLIDVRTGIVAWSANTNDYERYARPGELLMKACDGFVKELRNKLKVKRQT